MPQSGITTAQFYYLCYCDNTNSNTVLIKEASMDTIHFRIDEETKRLAMQAAKRQQTDLTKLMRQKAEELAEEERDYQKNSYTFWLESEIDKAIKRCEDKQNTFISNDESNQRITALRLKLSGESGE
jgi:antitoxin component of RelBE/YafQ-DinJ toxin-antitoxin module